MSEKDFILEIGCEEIPARFIDQALTQLATLTAKWFSSQRIKYKQLRTYATPRRLAIFADSVSQNQDNKVEEVKGPALRIAKTSDGAWSKAAEGFARKCGVGLEELTIKEIKGENYVVARINDSGQATKKVLERDFSEVLQNIHFPKTMRWNETIRFIRPVRWLVCMFGDEVVPITWAGLTADQWTSGHRFLGSEVKLGSSDQYENNLREQYVLVDVDKRREAILRQIHDFEIKKGWTIPINTDLLEEVNHLVEYPTVFDGTFNEEFLSLPKDVLVTTMKEHQRYFPVETKEGKLLPFFVAVRNGNSQGLEYVVKGNEKVLHARLADARFFYEEDLTILLHEFNKKLESILFHQELGSLADKVKRIQTIAGEIANKLQLEEKMVQKVQRAAELSKFSLATQMVSEFPELEGSMGREYAIKAGEAAEVAEAIYEHYLPRFAGDTLPKSTLGKIISLADKIDTVVSSFGIGIQPTASQDPYALRRKGTGIVRILLEENSPEISLAELVQFVLTQLENGNLLKEAKDIVVQELHKFLTTRIRAVLEEERVRYDVIDAVTATGIEDLTLVLAKAKVLNDQLERPTFKEQIEAFTRVMNLAGHAKNQYLDPTKFTESEEKELHQAFEEAEMHFNVEKKQKNVLGMYQALVSMIPAIHQFFNHVMVMVEDESVRENRLMLLKRISLLFHEFASFNKIVF